MPDQPLWKAQPRFLQQCLAAQPPVPLKDGLAETIRPFVAHLGKKKRKKPWRQSKVWHNHPGRLVPVCQHQIQAGRRTPPGWSFRNQVSGWSQGGLHGVQGKPVPGSALTMPINEVRAEHSARQSRDCWCTSLSSLAHSPAFHLLPSPPVITIHIPVSSFPWLPLLCHTSLHLPSLGAENFLDVAAGTLTASNPCVPVLGIGRN